ncbi:MAG: hypothetical protein ACTSRP_04945 [Candidatus Helarchaeota archaeon]
MKNENKKETLYLFAVYYCSCKTVIIWYPDIINDPESKFFPEYIECPNCKQPAEVYEKKWINPERDLVREFLRIASEYEFKQLLMIDEQHVHFVWTKPDAHN